MLKKLFRILSISGSMIAFHVGSGFASGQEILQFYTSFGVKKGFLICGLALGLFVVFSYILLECGRLCAQDPVRLQYRHLGGVLIGEVFHTLTPFLMALVLCVTTAGGGATLNTLFSIPTFLGRIVIGLPVLITVLLGLKWITALSGSLGPIIILCALCLGGFGAIRGRENELWTMLPHTSANWVVSAISYACFGTITQIPYLLTVGSQLQNKSESGWVSVLGSGGYILTGAVMHLGLYRSLPEVLGEQLPALRLAREVSDFVGWFYGVILLFSIYTTAVPLLWSVCKAVQPNEHQWKYRATAILLTVFACVGSVLPFDRLLGILYPYIGYVSALFFVTMLLRAVLGKRSQDNEMGHRSARAV